MDPVTQHLRTIPLLMTLTLPASPAMADDSHPHEHRQHEVHQHGVAQLNLALDGHTIYLELDSPGSNIIGFEHTPVSDADHAAIDSAVARLKDGERLFQFDTAAVCRMQDVKIASALIDAGHDGHAHADEADAERASDGHADVVVAYHFECAHPDRLNQLRVGLFDAFAKTERLNVQFVVGNRQGAEQLSATNPVLRF
jgi:hypothetical protein